MANYIYKAKNRSGQVVSGVLVAESQSAVMERLLGMGLTPLDLSCSNISEISSKSGTPRFQFRKAVKRAEVATFMRQLGDLLSAGVPLVRALTTLSNQQSNIPWKKIIHQIKTSVVSGGNLADALAEHPRIFSELQINLIRSGEVSGSLETVLSRIADFSEKEQNLISRVKSALAYPALLFMVGTGSVIFLMTFFIPRFATIFSDMGQELPTPTLILMAISKNLRIYSPLIVILIIVAIYMFRKWVSTKSGRYQWDAFKLQIPVVKDIVTKIAVSRFCLTLGTLIKSGVPLLTALKVVKGATGNEIISQEIGEITSSIREGQSLADPLRVSKVFPPNVVEMIAVGEEAGNVENVLFKIAEAYDVEVDNAVRIFVSLLEPMMIIFMACVVGFIVISMLLPVFSLNSMIK